MTSDLILGNKALIEKKYTQALKHYHAVLAREPELASMIKANIQLVEKKLAFNFMASLDAEGKQQNAETIDIVVPVYNALDDVKLCLQSLARHTDGFKVRVLVVNDGSNVVTSNWLHEFCASDNLFQLIEHPANKGYTCAVNTGLRASTAEYVITQNSDTVVPAGWLQGMIRCMKSDPKIGVVGPLSNAASWQNVPTLHDESGGFAVNDLPEGKTVETMAQLVASISTRQYPRLPFVNGFCFMICRRVIDRLGLMDEENFPVGYGEENDYCIRAVDAGFELAIADDVYVYHSKSKSFGHARRKDLSNQGTTNLKRKHTAEKYNSIIQEIKRNYQLTQIRDKVIENICREKRMHFDSILPSKNEYQYNTNLHNKVAIVIPVFNAPSEVKECIESLIKYAHKNTRIIVINDASTDPDIINVLSDKTYDKKIEIYHCSTNKGFSGAVNWGIKLAGESDVIVLNSDTIVTKDFHIRLRFAAYSDETIGTVTPTSNNAGPFSLSYDTPEKINKDLIDLHSRALIRGMHRSYVKTPTAHGYCMYIKRKCIHSVGFFDQKAFPKGYGEENDFCMRATKNGWTHIIDFSTFVYHKRSASFGSERGDLVEQGRKVIDIRYPEYTKIIREFISSQSLQKTINDSSKAFQQYNKSFDDSTRNILYILPKLGDKGGTPQTNSDLMIGIRSISKYNTYLLISDGWMLTLSIESDNCKVILDEKKLNIPLRPDNHSSAEYDAIVLDWILRYSIDLVHYRHIGFHSLSAAKFISNLNIPIVFSFHDFYSVCPTVKLLDHNNIYCSGHCGNSFSGDDCKIDLWKGVSNIKLKDEFIYDWQALMSNFIQYCDILITTSESARSLIYDKVPITREKPFHVIPHGRNFINFNRPTSNIKINGKLKVLVPGGISAAKGGLALKEISKQLESSVEFHVLGTISRDIGITNEVVNHGVYERNDFVSIVKDFKHQPHIGAILSIWPETYCHTLTELWAAGLPVIAFDIGAVGERIRETGGGWLLPNNDTEKIVETLKFLLRNSNQIDEAAAKVYGWQKYIGSSNNVSWMANKYNSIYCNLF